MIGKVSGTAKSRIHNSYVSRAKSVSAAVAVEAVEPVPKANNEVSYSSGNYLYTSDTFYENIKILRDEYKRFYNNHLSLKRALEDFKLDDNIYLNLKDLINKYNNTIISLEQFDNVMGTQHFKRLKEIVEGYSKSLVDLGISFDNDIQIHLNEGVFLKLFEEATIATIFNPVKELGLIIYKELRDIKVPRNSSSYGEDGEVIPGLIVDDLS